MKRLKLLSLIISVVAFAYLALGTYVITKQTIQHLLICADSGGFNMPCDKAICRTYLFNFRGTEQDINALHQDTGADYVIQGESSIQEREEVLIFLIDKGLDVNRINTHKLTALHGAVLTNSIDQLELLLRHGANPAIKDERYQLTPLELALKLKEENKFPQESEVRKAIIKRLEQS